MPCLWGLALANACSDTILLCASCQCCAVQVSIKKLDIMVKVSVVPHPPFFIYTMQTGNLERCYMKAQLQFGALYSPDIHPRHDHSEAARVSGKNRTAIPVISIKPTCALAFRT